MTLDEFVRLYETEGPFELIEGERIPVNPVVAGHGDKARKIHDAFAEHNRKHQTGVSCFELAYVLTYSVDRYPNDGVEIIWVVDPRQKCVTVRGRDSFRKLHLNDVLTGGDVIPGFEMPVKAIFE
jgi:Uma2 family endonuclease